MNAPASIGKLQATLVVGFRYKPALQLQPRASCNLPRARDTSPQFTPFLSTYNADRGEALPAKAPPAVWGGQKCTRERSMSTFIRAAYSRCIQPPSEYCVYLWVAGSSTPRCTIRLRGHVLGIMPRHPNRTKEIRTFVTECGLAVPHAALERNRDIYDVAHRWTVG